jgi:hypothetical protein
MGLFTSTLRRFRFVRYSIRAIGLGRLLASTPALVADPEIRDHDGGFDRRFGTDTTAGVTPTDAGLPAARRAGATMYLPTMAADLEAMLDALGWPATRQAQATFVDVGSGKGRVVMLAAMRRFRSVMGVELSASLHATAERNLAHIATHGVLQSPVRLVCDDATAFAIPEGPLILHLYHPFREDVAAVFIDRVAASLASSPRPAAILYGHPLLQPCLDPEVFRRGGVFEPTTEGGRTTRSFRVSWSIWANEGWVASVRRPAVAC